VGTEMNVSFSLDEAGKYKMQGYIDRLSKSPDGSYEIHDYKTSAYLPGKQQADKDRQLGLYQIGVQTRWPDIKNIRLIWHYLAHDTDLVSYRTADDITSLVENTKSLIDEIELAKDFPPKDSGLCQWCEYPDLCPRQKHIYKVEALPVNQYLTEPGVVLVNKYAELKDEAKKIEGEMDKVKEALLDYAARECVEVIKGSDCKATVRFDKKLKFPRKSDAERSELDSVIKGAGMWDEVSELDTTALGRIVEQGSWSQELINQVLKYGQIEPSSTVHMSKLKDWEK